MNAHPAHVLKPELLQAIAAQGGVRRYPAHAVIINEGDAADSLFIHVTAAPALEYSRVIAPGLKSSNFNVRHSAPSAAM